MSLANNGTFLDYQTDVLFLLVGGNPLPNYVAALLLARTGEKEPPLVCLLHTCDTTPIAERLRARLKEGGAPPRVELCQIPQAGGRAIAARMDDILKDPILAGKRVGLNYSGGTKPMAVHVYHALRKKFPGTFFSYLDAGTLTMFVDRGDDPTQELDCKRVLELSLQDVVALHGYTLDALRQGPQYAELYRPLAQVCATPEGFHQWAGRWDKKRKSKGWLRTDDWYAALPTPQEYPRLRPVIAAFDALGGTPEGVAACLGFDGLGSCRKWLLGTWLEEYSLEALAGAAQALHINHYGITLLPRPVPILGAAPEAEPAPAGKEFELDLAAMVGHQLFAISCIASDQGDGETKKHLFEAYVRARQLGGDEARVGLVCCVDEPAPLQAEIQRDWDAKGKIRVFGRRDLRPLAGRLQDWIRTANREG